MKTQENGQSAELAASPSSALWIVACVLTKNTPTGVTFSQCITWRKGVTEDEAKGAAVTYALENKKGFAIEMITTAKIELSND